MIHEEQKSEIHQDSRDDLKKSDLNKSLADVEKNIELFRGKSENQTANALGALFLSKLKKAIQKAG